MPGCDAKDRVRRGPNSSDEVCGTVGAVQRTRLHEIPSLDFDPCPTSSHAESWLETGYLGCNHVVERGLRAHFDAVEHLKPQRHKTRRVASRCQANHLLSRNTAGLNAYHCRFKAADQWAACSNGQGHSSTSLYRPKDWPNLRCNDGLFIAEDCA